jgi:hypothetical protein
MMWEDPIVEETRRARMEIVEACGEDIAEFFRFIRERETHHAQDFVTLPSNRPEPVTRESESR